MIFLLVLRDFYIINFIKRKLWTQSCRKYQFQDNVYLPCFKPYYVLIYKFRSLTWTLWWSLDVKTKLTLLSQAPYSENWNRLKWPFVLSIVLHSSFVGFAWHVSLDSWLKADGSSLGDFSQSEMKSRTLGQLMNAFVAEEQGWVPVIRPGSRIRCSSYLAQYCRCCCTPTRLQLPLLGYTQRPKVAASVVNPRGNNYRETANMAFASLFSYYY